MDPALSPTLTYVSLAVGISTLALTLLNLLALHATFLTTLHRAPTEIRDVLATLRAQLLEEREALRQQTRELRNKKAAIRGLRGPRQHPAHAGRATSSSRGLASSFSSGTLRSLMHGGSLSHAEETLGGHVQVIRDLWRRFKVLERPFLVVVGGGKAEGVRAAWVEETEVGGEKGVGEEGEGHGESAVSYVAVYRCDFVHRFVWWRSKGEVLKLADAVQRVMIRRMEREVTNCRMMLKQIRDGGDGPEDINNPKFDSGSKASRGTTPLGLRRRPVGESQQVYSTSESSDDSAGTKAKGRVHVAEVGSMSPRRSPTRRAPPPSEAWFAGGDGWRQPAGGQFSRGGQGPPPLPVPVILEMPRGARPMSRHGYEGPPEPYDFRRGRGLPPGEGWHK